MQTAGDYTAAILRVWSSSSSSFRYTQSARTRCSTQTPFNSESSPAPCKLDREDENDNKQPYVHSTRNNICFFLCHASFLHLSLLSSASPRVMEVFMFKARTPQSISLPLSCLLPLSRKVCVCGTCVQHEGCSCSRSTKPGPCVEMQPPGWAVLSLPTSPAGSRGSSWLVALCLQTDGNGQRRGEVENQRERWGWGVGGLQNGGGEGREKESVCSH